MERGGWCATTYYWRITPVEIKDGQRVELVQAAAKGRFTTGKPVNRVAAADAERHRNPRRGAHWVNMPAVPYSAEEPLSPWHEIKAYRKSPPPTQCMVQEGLRQTGYLADLQELAEKYQRACVADYQNQKTLRENMAPDKILGCGQPDFVGWAGIGPVANLIEYLLGFKIDAPDKIVTWTIRQHERHGLTNLRLNDFMVDLIAQPAAGNGSRHITVKSGGEFTLRLKWGEQVVEERIVAGTRQLDLQSFP